jgi:hypothetical protein
LPCACWKRASASGGHSNADKTVPATFLPPFFAPTESLELQALWQDAALEEEPRRGFTDCPEQWLVLITCRDEQHQVELLQRFQTEGLPARALIS